MKLREQIKGLLEEMAPAIPAEAGKIMADCTRKLLESDIISKALRANLVVISPQLPEQSLGMAEKEKLGFEVLSDAGNNVARDFGIVYSLPEELRSVYNQFGIDLEKANGDQCFELPLPATYIIDQNGTITLAFVEPDHTKRLEPSEIVDSLRG